MQKSYLLILVAFITTVTAPMEETESSLCPQQKAKFIVTLYLEEREQNNSDKNDQYACNVLGIPWEEKSKYYTTSALFENTNNEDFCDWAKCFPHTLPLPTISNPSCTINGSEKLILFPKRVSHVFVEELREEPSITLEHTSFSRPVEIEIKLGRIIQKNTPNPPHCLKGSQETKALTTEQQKSDELLKQFPQAPKHSPTTSSHKKFIIPVGAITLGIIAYIIYLYHHNQLSTQFSSLINWLHLPFMSNKV